MAARSLLTSDFSDCQPFRPCPLRRCPGLRDRFGHHLVGCSVGLLWCKDGSFALGQAYRQGAQLRERGVVGSRQQGDVARGESRLVHLSSVAFAVILQTTLLIPGHAHWTRWRGFVWALGDAAARVMACIAEEGRRAAGPAAPQSSDQVGIVLFRSHVFDRRHDSRFDVSDEHR